MNDVLREVAKAQREKTPFCERFIEFLQAGLDQDTMDAVNYNIIAYQEKKGILKTDRDFDYYGKQAMPDASFKNNESSIMQNKSDAAVLEKMAAYKTDNSLDMGEEAQKWFEYVVEGTPLTADEQAVGDRLEG